MPLHLFCPDTRGLGAQRGGEEGKALRVDRKQSHPRHTMQPCLGPNFPVGSCCVANSGLALSQASWSLDSGHRRAGSLVRLQADASINHRSALVDLKIRISWLVDRRIDTSIPGIRNRIKAPSPKEGFPIGPEPPGRQPNGGGIALC
ncbi:hypothetical protein SNK03_002193 [Fusarium graminearum]